MKLLRTVALLTCALTLSACTSEPAAKQPLADSQVPAEEPTVIASAETSTPAPVTEPTPPALEELPVTGSVHTYWTLDESLGDMPEDCTGPQNSYDVLLLDNADVMLALVPVSNPVVVERTFGDHGIFSLECSFTYELATDSESPVFTVQLTSYDGTQVEMEKVIGRTEFTSGKGPDLTVTFCPTCGS